MNNDREFGATRSPKWEALEKKFITGKVCSVCGTDKNLNAHHIKPFHKFPAMELMISNLIALCHEHHLWIGHIGNFKGWNPAVRTDSNIWRAKVRCNRTRMKK